MIQLYNYSNVNFKERITFVFPRRQMNIDVSVGTSKTFFYRDHEINILSRRNVVFYNSSSNILVNMLIGTCMVKV